MGVSGVKNLELDFSDMSGGINSRAPRHALKSNEVSAALNAIFPERGSQRAPGYAGVSAAALFVRPVRGEWDYRHNDGTETHLIVSDLKLWTVDAAAGTKTEIGAGKITSDTPCYAVNQAGKLWIVNGTDFIKVEDDLNVYAVQIAVPSGASAVAVAGGSLAAGVYGVYVAYARVVGGQYLYSLPESLGNVTLSASNLTVQVTVPDSADAQVTHKVAFLTDAGGAVPYYYAQVAQGTATIDVTSSATRNGLILMSTVSANNQVLPITPDGIYSFDDKLYVWDAGTQTCYWSLKTDVNPFDLERFLAQNFRTLARPISSMFSVGTDLYFNHKGLGVSVAYNGDMSSIIKHVQKTLWFVDTNVPEGRSNVVEYKGAVLGLTNDGFRFFDELGFSDDLSFNLKPDMTGIYNSIDTMTPSAIVFTRAGKRTEYRFSWRNRDWTEALNNYQLVLNLDFYFDPNRASRTWEMWETGFDHQVVIGGVWYGTQSTADAAQVVAESGVSDINCFDYLGTYNTTKVLKQWYVLTRTIINSLDSITVWGAPYSLATSGATISGNIIIFDAANSKFGFSVTGVAASPAVLPADGAGGLTLPFVMNPQYPIGVSDPVSHNCRGNSVAMELSQIADDAEFFLYSLQLPKGKEVTNNMT